MSDVAAIILAAGRSSRFGADATLSKMTALWRGQPLVRHVAMAVSAAKISRAIVVTGHAAESVKLALANLDVTLVHNAGFASGMASSLHRGLAAVGDEAAGAVVLLGDMPQVTPELIDLLVSALCDAPAGTKAIVPTWQSQWGNPVLLTRAAFADVKHLHGDQGARKMLEHMRQNVVTLAVNNAVILNDIDTAAALAALAQSDNC